MNECNGFGDDVLTVRLVVGRELVVGITEVDDGKQEEGEEVVDNIVPEDVVEEGCAKGWLSS